MEKKGISRRAFLKGAAVTAVSAAVVSVLPGCETKPESEASTQCPPCPSPSGSSVYTLNPQDYDYRDTNTDFATLFSDWKFGGLTLHHRMVKSAAGSDTAGSEQEICAYYSNFAKGGVEMVWVEDYANVFDHYTSPRKKSKEEAHLAALAKAVHDAGGYIGYQLSCMGQSFSGFDPATAAQYESAYAEYLNEEEIRNLKSDFINGAIYLRTGL